MARKTKIKKKNSKRKKTKIGSWKLKLVLSVLLFMGFVAHHLYRHPALIFLPISESFYKNNVDTWESYKDSFIAYGSKDVDPEFLAALAQTESMGNPLALTYWKLAYSKNPLNWFRPASTATGILQVTSPTWRRMKNFCLHENKLIRHGKQGFCRGNLFRFRVVPSHSIHLVSAWFHHFLGRKNINANETRKLLSVLHLCGDSKAKRFLNSGLNFSKLGKCGSHRPASYFAKVEKNYEQIRNHTSIKARQIARK